MSKTAYTDGTFQGEERAAQLYSDIDLFFGPKIGSKDITKVTDVVAVKRSVRNLVLTNFYEKPFHPEIGSNIRGLLFENITPQISHFIGKQIEMLIKNYEPRCRLVDVSNRPNLDKNGYSVSISFYVVNTPNPVVVETFLERLR